MNREQLQSRLKKRKHQTTEASNSVDVNASIFKVRLASITEESNTVPLVAPNYGLPIFVYPKIYLDASHINAMNIRKVSAHDDLYQVTIKVSFLGCERLNLIADNPNLVVVVFVDNYAVLKLDVTQTLFDAEFDLACFATQQQANYFVTEVKKFK